MSRLVCRVRDGRGGDAAWTGDARPSIFVDAVFQRHQFPKRTRNEEMSPKPISLDINNTPTNLFIATFKALLRGTTDVDDDGDAVGQWEVTAEIALRHIEILLSALVFNGDTIGTSLGGPEGRVAVCLVTWQGSEFGEIRKIWKSAMGIYGELLGRGCRFTMQVDVKNTSAFLRYTSSLLLRMF